MLLSMLALCGAASGQEAAPLYPAKSGYFGRNWVIDGEPGAT
jgi:hypothetical protein